MEHIIEIESIESLTHDVKRFQCKKPAGYTFVPGQATDVSINKEGWQQERRPFTFTSLDYALDLEFIIKIYEEHNGVTNKLGSLVPGDELIIEDAWGAIEYKGPGYFIAGGAGITPFIAILRNLKMKNHVEGNKLFFSNKTIRDIILLDELHDILGKNVIHTITDEATTAYHNGLINEAFLKANIDDFSKHFYLCGPPKMVEALQECITKLGAEPEGIIFEK